MNNWLILEIEKNQFSKEAPEAPKALYMITMAVSEESNRITFGLPYQQVEVIMKHFKVTKPADLAGKSFESAYNEPTSALDLLVVQTKHGGEYTPPSSSKVRLMLAEALAKFREPDYSNIDKKTVARAIQEIWSGWQPTEQFLTWLKFQVHELSDGKVMLVDADVAEFQVRAKGPAVYLALIRGEESKLIILGPYSHPASFVPARENDTPLQAV